MIIDHMHKVSIFLLIASLTLSGCSVIEKNIYLKPTEENNGWTIVKDPDYEPYYGRSTHYFYSCDSLSTVRIDFQSQVKSVLQGPPLLPILPIPFWNRNDSFYVSMRVKSTNDTDVVKLSEHIHLFFNDSTKESLLSFRHRYSDTEIKELNKSFWKSECDSKSSTNNYMMLGWYVAIKPTSIQTLYVSFDEEFNRQLRADYKPFKLIKRNRYRYCGFYFPAH